MLTTSHGLRCRTPCKIYVERSIPFEAIVELSGYKPLSVQVNSGLSAGGVATLAANALVPGWALLDLASGATKKVDPNPLIVELEPLIEGAANSDAVSSVAPAIETMDADAIGRITYKSFAASAEGGVIWLNIEWTARRAIHASAPGTLIVVDAQGRNRIAVDWSFDESANPGDSFVQVEFGVPFVDGSFDHRWLRAASLDSLTLIFEPGTK